METTFDGDGILIEPDDPRSCAATELIGRLTAELAWRYDHLDDGTGNFRPEDVLVGGAVFLIGRIERRPIACGAFRPLEPGVAEIKRIFVAPEARGRGYGKRILAELERRAVGFGYSAIRLETGTMQPESIALYAGMGYHRIPNFGPYVDGPWSICYEKTLVLAVR